MNKFLDPKIKKAIQDVIFSYKEKRDNVFVDLDISEEAYKKEMTDIRAKVFDDFETRLELAKKNLEQNGFKVYEASDKKQAQDLLKQLTRGSNFIAKSKSNTSREIEWEKVINAQETDLGDYIVQMFKEEDMHYVLPSIHITAQTIAEKIKEMFGSAVEPDAQKLTRYLSEKIRQDILKAEVGITGANFFTQTGQLLLLENEGNISLLSRLPRKHIVITTIDKLTESVEAATKLCQTAAIFGTGQKITQYISIISGPAKTADIQNQMVMGAQGAKEVHVILVDNGRRRLIQEGFGQLLRCINCGACINFCPVYHNLGKKYGGSYIGSKGVVLEAFLNTVAPGQLALSSSNEKGSFDCTLCGNCKENCPMSIDLPKLIRDIRILQEKNNLQTSANKEMLEKIKKHGNPFGEVSDKEIPDKLYCC